MAGYITLECKGSSPTLKDLEDLIMRAKKMGVSPNQPVVMTLAYNQLIFAFEATVRKQALPGVTRPDKSEPMRPRRRK